MRNDAHDEINDLPSLSAVCTETPDQSATVAAAEPLTENQAQINTPASSSSKAVGILSAVSFALVCASASFVWWSMQRMQLLEQQLVATQDSFSRISEDAEGRIKAISGQFTATESSVLGDNERLKMRLNKIESAAVETAKQQQISTAAHAAQLTKISNELSTLVDALAVMKKHSEQQQQVLEQQKKHSKHSAARTSHWPCVIPTTIDGPTKNQHSASATLCTIERTREKASTSRNSTDCTAKKHGG